MSDLMFTPEELHWMSIIEEDESLLDDIHDKRDLQISKKFIDFTKMIIKYGNLRIGENLERGKKVIRIHKNIPTKFLEKDKQEYIIFNGLYVVTDVVYISPEIIDEFYKFPTKEKARELGIPDDVHIAPKVFTVPGKQVGVGLVKNEFSQTYIQFPNQWSYPVW